MQDVDPALLDELLAQYDGWIESDADGNAEPAGAPPPLPSEPKRFKR
ncbi:hypothetical protein [Kribbella shirazensis]|uniref:Uncharacterized protein n=1 Tax=Kribbella shirazensis TaxID=1105143 RepID=A0A7X5VC84_9ACTN|nr:hypothetical protein [Kribbella shirazensis]NIK58126.1 hypothetical protein [Kribbella shirazensis]